ncbi:hypothetical protein ACFUIZ_22140 [Streptomyces cinereoruber]|uniref:hypothetical protein n=1 Tax=Streptomyces cinereoruber TaxID=67260 RepID=UPI00363AC7BE
MNRAQDVVEEFVDDVEDSFLAMCARAPGESLRHAVSPYDLTMFNTPQLERLVAELEELREEEKTPVVRRVVEEAHRAVRRSGYLPSSATDAAPVRAVRPTRPTDRRPPTEDVVTVESPTHPEPGIRLARLADAVGLPPVWPPAGEYLDALAERTGLRVHDLLLVADLPVPGAAWLFDESAGASSRMVARSLDLPASDRHLLRARARSMTAPPGTLAPRRSRPYELYPPGFGPLLLRMLALRNLSWSGAAKVMCLMSGVCKAASTIGAVGRGAKPLDAEMLDGFAATLGTPVSVLAALTGVRASPENRAPAPGTVDTAALVWEVRHLTRHQVDRLTEYAGALGGPDRY